MTPRPYKSGVREDGALRTRLAILDAAEILFVRDGYTRTKLSDIAEHAGVALNTVYSSVGGKRELVTAVVDRYVDHDVIQEALTALESAASMDELLRRLVAGVRQSYAVTLRPALIVMDAARSDEVMESALAAMNEPFFVRLRRLARRCVELGAPSDRLTEDAVFGVFWFYLGYSAWQVLHELGWPADEQERWVHAQLAFAISELERPEG